MTHSSSARIRQRLSHPVIDCDGHWVEPAQIFFDFLQSQAGTSAVDGVQKFLGGLDRWYSASPAERERYRLVRPGYWGQTHATVDRAAAMIPRLLHERLPECGIDFSVIYPTLGIHLSVIPDESLRRAAVRAMNTMAAEMFRPYSDRLTPAGIVCTYTPQEAVDEAKHIVTKLGMKAAMLNGLVPREAVSLSGGPGAPWVDNLALDSAYDYEPFWQKLVELRLAYTTHSGTTGRLPTRRSTSSFVSNHVGHFADAHHAAARGLFLGGVGQRHPSLRFGFLEGGVAWAASLCSDLTGHWSKLNRTAMHTRKPTDLDTDLLRTYFERYATDPRYEGKIDAIVTRPQSTRPATSLEELTVRDIDADEFAHVRISDEQDLRDLFSAHFYFGCESDDPLTAMAFQQSMLKTKLKPVLGSDISHFDVTDITAVLHEAWELVEDGLLTEENFREFTFTNAVELHGSMNPTFFQGTAVEQAVASFLPRRPSA